MRVAIIGPRAFDDGVLIDRCVQRLAVKHGDDLEIVSRGMSGTGKLAQASAVKHCKLPVQLRPYTWEEGKYASEEQSRAFAVDAVELVAIWDGEDEHRGRDVLHTTRVCLYRQTPVFFYEVQQRRWVTERSEQWKITERAFPLVRWYHRANYAGRWRGY